MCLKESTVHRDHYDTFPISCHAAEERGAFADTCVVCILCVVCYLAYVTLVWYPDPSVQAHARTRITACACGKEGSGEMVYPSAGPGM